jgi:hypothetical protein
VGSGDLTRECGGLIGARTCGIHRGFSGLWSVDFERFKAECAKGGQG